MPSTNFKNIGRLFLPLCDLRILLFNFLQKVAKDAKGRGLWVARKPPVRDLIPAPAPARNPRTAPPWPVRFDDDDEHRCAEHEQENFLRSDGGRLPFKSTAERLQRLAGGKRSATSGYADTPKKHPEGMPAIRVARCGMRDAGWETAGARGLGTGKSARPPGSAEEHKKSSGTSTTRRSALRRPSRGGWSPEPCGPIG